jgi:adenine-specific DNA-methyltransferase
VEFVPCASANLASIQRQHFSRNYYRDLDDLSGWNLGNRNIINTVNRIERFPQKIFPTFSFSTGIATLKNDIYKFIPESRDRDYYYFETSKGHFKIEKGICRELINANKVTTEEEINNLKEKIIFPYRFDTEKKKYALISEKTFKEEYPFAYKYLFANKTILADRDGGAGDYEAWYAYGRTQGLHVNGLKLFLPHITNDPSFVLSNDKKLLFCNGEAIVSDNERELLVLKRILESEIFWYYIVNTSKPYASGYFSLAKNYLKSFSIPAFTETEKDLLLEGGKRAVLNLLLRKYELEIDDISI